MQIFRNPGELPADYGPTVVSVGNFDGVHRGHRFLLNQVIERSRILHARSVAVTFEPHPTRLLKPEAGPPLITPSLDERLALLAETRIDATVVLPFTAEFSRQSGAEFVQNVLLHRLRAVEVHEGANFRFGSRAHSGVNELSTLGRQLGFGVHVYGAQHVRGIAVSSSAIRKLVEEGDVRRARWLLGRAFALHSTPAPGRGIGTRLTVPTINLAEYVGLVPAAGVYVTRMQVAQHCFDAVTNIGTRPTFGEASFAIETHLLDYDPAAQPFVLTAETPLQLTFLARLRDEQRWPTPEELKQQIGRDIRHAQRYLRRLPRTEAKAHITGDQVGLSL
jgi:riboflavin kinase/FMN adenylyltransferase